MTDEKKPSTRSQSVTGWKGKESEMQLKGQGWAKEPERCTAQTRGRVHMITTACWLDKTWPKKKKRVGGSLVWGGQLFGQKPQHCISDHLHCEAWWWLHHVQHRSCDIMNSKALLLLFCTSLAGSPRIQDHPYSLSLAQLWTSVLPQNKVLSSEETKMTLWPWHKARKQKTLFVALWSMVVAASCRELKLWHCKKHRDNTDTSFSTESEFMLELNKEMLKQHSSCTSLLLKHVQTCTRSHTHTHTGSFTRPKYDSKRSLTTV